MQPRRKRSKAVATQEADVVPVGLLGTSPQHKHTKASERPVSSQSSLHRALYTPASKTTINESMTAAAGPLLGTLEVELLSMIFLWVLAIPKESYLMQHQGRDFECEKWLATTGAISLALSCKMLFDVMMSSGRQEFRELTAMLATTSIPAMQCRSSSHPFLAQIQDEHRSSRAAMVMGEALKSMATHCASSHCLMSRRGTNRMSTQGQIRVAYDTAKRICAAGDDELIVATEPATKQRHASTVHRGFPPRTAVMLVSCKTNQTSKFSDAVWHSQSDLKTSLLTNLADEACLPRNVRIEQPGNIMVDSLAASKDGRHILIEFAALFALGHIRNDTDKTTYSYIWLWSADGGGPEFDQPTMYPVSLGAAVGNEDYQNMHVARPFELKKMWFCAPCEYTQRVDFNILLTSPLGGPYPDMPSVKCVRSRFHTVRSGVCTPDHGVIYDRDLPAVNMWSTDVQIELGHPYMTIITHDFAESRMVSSSVSVSEDGHLALAMLRSPHNSRYDFAALLDTNLEAYRFGLSDHCFPVECYPRESAGYFEFAPTKPEILKATPRFEGTLKSAALSPLGDRVAIEVQAHTGDFMSTIRIFCCKVSINMLRDAIDDDLIRANSDGSNLWELVASVQLILRARSLFMSDLTTSEMEDEELHQQDKNRPHITFSPCGRFVMLASCNVNAACHNFGQQLHIVDTDRSRNSESPMRQYVTTTAMCCMPRDVCWSRAGIWFRTNRGVLLFQPAVVEVGV